MKGEEEFSSVSPKAVSTPVPKSLRQPAKRQKTSNNVNGWKNLGGLNTVRADSEGTGSSLMPLEYSPVRHRSAIERVLSALQGTDPILDSATKVWTTFAVAKNFDITHSPLEDYIIRWLRAYPNSYFLEVLPEVSHQIADGLQNYDLARDSFGILVGEEALDNVRQAREPWVHKRTTFGRKKEELPEHIHTRVEYASKSFLERMNSDFTKFVSGMQWIDELPEVRRLSAYTQPELQDTVNQLKDRLKEYVRGAIYKIICADYDTVPGPDLHHEGGHELLPRLDRAAVWANMQINERILSRTCWEALRSSANWEGPSNFDVQISWNSNGGLHRLSNIEMCELIRGSYREIRYSELKALIRNGQTHLDHTQIPDLTLHNAQQEMKANPLSTGSHRLSDRNIIGAQNPNQPWESLSRVNPGLDLYNAQRESNVKPLPKPSYALPDRTLNGARETNTNGKPLFSTTAQPVDVPKPLKRTQDFRDALSPPDDKESEIDVRTKWPFGAARDDHVAQVMKSVDGLHVTSIPSDRQSAVVNAPEESASQKYGKEANLIGVEPWRGYSDHLSYVSETLEYLAPNTYLTTEKLRGQKETSPAVHKSRRSDSLNWVQQHSEPRTHSTPTKAAPKKTFSVAEPDAWVDYDAWDGDDRVQQECEDLRPQKNHLATKFFDLGRFFDQAQDYIEHFANHKLRYSWDHGCLKESLDLGIVNTLVCLDDSEWKYLPLWAGGNDDGSNGVYNDDLPTAENGFTTAGPEVHDGTTPANSVKAPSEFELVSAGDSASTFNASTATNRGFSDAIRRDRVHAVDSADDSMSDSFTMVTPSVDSDDEETFARKQIEAQERIEEAEEAAAYEARRIARGKGKMVAEDETYADLFDGEGEDDGNDTDRVEVNDEDDEDMVMV